MIDFDLWYLMAETNVLCCYKFFINSCNDKQVILTFDNINYLIKYTTFIVFIYRRINTFHENNGCNGKLVLKQVFIGIWGIIKNLITDWPRKKVNEKNFKWTIIYSNYRLNRE